MTTGTLTKPAPAASRVAEAPATRPVRRYLKHVRVVARRSLIKTMRTPEQLIDVTVQPIIFLLLFVYVFGGAISHGSRHDYLEYLFSGENYVEYQYYQHPVTHRLVPKNVAWQTYNQVEYIIRRLYIYAEEGQVIQTPNPRPDIRRRA